MKKIIFIVAVLVFVNAHALFAKEWDKARDFAVDQELSEMNAASKILPPGQHENSNGNPKQGTIPGQGLSDGGAVAKGSSDSGTSSGGNDGLGGGGNLDAGTTPDSGTGSVSGGGIDADLNVGTGDGTGDLVTDTTSDSITETPLVGGDISTGGDDYLISADASVGDTEVSVDLIPSDSFEDTLLGEITDIGAEIDASGDLSGSEAEIGIEADVDGSVSGDDTVSDPADGLSLTSSI